MAYQHTFRRHKTREVRVGDKAGSLERELVEKHGFPCPPAMVESALRYIEIAESEGYHDLIVSLKSSDVITAVEAYRLYAKQANYPTHIGIAAGNGKGVIFKRGEIVRNVLEHEMVDALLEEIDLWEKEEAAKGTLPGEAARRPDGRVKLPVLN